MSQQYFTVVISKPINGKTFLDCGYKSSLSQNSSLHVIFRISRDQMGVIIWKRFTTF